MQEFATSKTAGLAGAMQLPTCLKIKRAYYRQVLRIMKMTAILLLTACLQVSARGFTQDAVSLSLKDATLQQVFTAIEKQTDYHFFYKNSLLQQAKKVTIRGDNMTVEQVLEICFKDQPITYSINGKVVTINAKKKTNNEQVVVDTIPKGLITVKGELYNKSNEPVVGATVQVKGSNKATVTNDSGKFVLEDVSPTATLIVTSVNYERKEINVNGRIEFRQQLDIRTVDLAEVNITVSTGYERIAPERRTGSYTKVDNTLINRSISTNILDRIKGITSGVLFDNNVGNGEGGFSVRGRSTIFASTQPLIVLDNFAYDGDLSTINPNDIEDITILKDAGAASIWGVRAANGVVVITTKKGKYNTQPTVAFNSNVTIGRKPDLYAKQDMTTSDLIDAETFLYNQGFFASDIATPYVMLSPVVNILSDTTLSFSEKETRINSLRSSNVKDDLLKYYYRPTVNQQYSLSLNGGNAFNRYYFSIGYDKNLESLISNANDRLTINGQNTFNLMRNKLEVSIGLLFTTEKHTANAGNTQLNYPNERSYTKYANDDGSPVAYFPVRQEWIEANGYGQLLDWSLKPLEELNRKDFTSHLTNYLLNASLKYKFLPGLDATVLYQYSKGIVDAKTFYSQESFTARNLINQFSQVSSAPSINRIIPLGDILQKGQNDYHSYNARGQVNYNQNFNRSQITALAGAEVKSYDAQTNTVRYYGYNEELGIVANTDYVSYTPTLPEGFYGQVPGSPRQSGISDRYLSYFANASYTYDGKYTVSASARKDESNLFGVKSNQKGVPLWSVGASWNLHKESFYQLQWLPLLKLRITNGYNGNVDKTASAFITAQSGSFNPFNQPTSSIINPPNPSLRWEKINITNVGIDFALFQNRITGSFDYYFKNGKDIIGNSPLAPSTGVNLFRGNSANIKGRGFDLVLNSLNIDKAIKWSTIFLLSQTTNKISKYLVQTGPLSFHEGYPYEGVFSYRWAGLDPDNGNPLGYVDGKSSDEWSSIINADSIGRTTMYKGSSSPTFFGSLLNTFSYRHFSLSFNLIYKLGYYFRARSIDYSLLYSKGITGHRDYEDRWQQPGDEKNTNVPSSFYPGNYAREQFYGGSAILVEKADHIRLHDIRLSYVIRKNVTRWLPAEEAQFYLYASNVGVLWKANGKDLDPESLPAEIPAPKTLAIGFKVTF